MSDLISISALTDALQLCDNVVDDVWTVLDELPRVTPRIVVGIEGGNVQWTLADTPGVRVTVVDYDVEYTTDFQLFRVRDKNGDDEYPASVYDEQPEVAPDYFDLLDLAPVVNGENELLSEQPDPTKWMVTTRVAQLGPQGGEETVSGYYAGETAEEAMAEANRELVFIFGTHMVMSQRALPPSRDAD